MIPRQSFFLFFNLFLVLIAWYILPSSYVSVLSEAFRAVLGYLDL